MAAIFKNGHQMEDAIIILINAFNCIPRTVSPEDILESTIVIPTYPFLMTSAVSDKPTKQNVRKKTRDRLSNPTNT